MSSKHPKAPRPAESLDQMEAPDPGLEHGPRTADDLELDEIVELPDPASTDPNGPFDHVRVPKAAPSPWIGKKLGGRYAIFGVVGKGGAGHVFRAVQEPLGRVVAVKVLRTDLSPAAQKTFGDRFLREAALAGRLAHPALVTVHDYGHQAEEADGVPAGTRWVVMELLEGRTLWRRIKEEACLPPREAARIAAALARGLRHAHSQGLVHRDVKPNNVVLVKDDDGVEQPKLVDFGLVKPATGDGPRVTEVGHYMGTPAYMPPEQADGREVDGRADQYALGCVLYHMLSGVVPFEANTPLGIAVQHRSDQVPPISRRTGVAVAPALEAIVRRSMAKTPEERFPDCGAMADALEAWLQGLEAPQPPRRPWRWVLVAAAVAALAIGGAAVALVAGLAGGAGLAVGVWSGAAGPELAEPMAIEDEDDGVAEAPVGDGAEAPDLEIDGPPEPSPESDEPAAPVDGPEPELPAPLPTPAVAQPAAPKPAAPKPAASKPAASKPAASKPTAPKPAEAPPADPKPAAPKPAAPQPVAEPSAPTPAPAESAPKVPPGALAYDDVVMSPEDAAAAIAWVNRATAEELEAAGVYRRGVEVVLAGRPFVDMEAFAGTRMIGTKTVEAALRGAGRR